MGSDEGQFRLPRGSAQGRLKSPYKMIAIGKGTLPPRLLRYPRRMLGYIAKGIDEDVARHDVYVMHGYHCAASQAPSLARSSSVIPVSLPSGIALLRTACASIWGL